MLIYILVTPELCATQSFRRKLALVYRQRELNRIVIDEAHCISGGLTILGLFKILLAGPF